MDKTCPMSNGGKTNPEPIGFIAEKINIDVPPTSIPVFTPSDNPEIKIMTVINSMLGTNRNAYPNPIAKAEKIAALTRLFSSIRFL
jgi:hypothetical protein